MQTQTLPARRFHFLDREIEAVRQALTRGFVPEKWLIPALALAHFNKKSPQDAAAVLSCAIKGKPHDWNELRYAWRVDIGLLRGVYVNTATNKVEFRDQAEIATAADALYDYLVKTYELNSPTEEDRIQALEQKVSALSDAVEWQAAALKSLTKQAAATPA